MKGSTTITQFGNHLLRMYTARSMYMPDGVKGYPEVGNTAYITFDGFSMKNDRTAGYNGSTEDLSDTFGRIIQITREGDTC